MTSSKEKIDRIITLERKNTLWNHLITGVLYNGEVIAQKKEREYVIWTTDYIIGTFYPTLKIHFDSRNEITKIESELSLNGKFWLLILVCLIVALSLKFLFVPIFENVEYFGFSEIFKLLFFGVFTYGLYWVLRRIYNNERKWLVNELKVTVGLLTQEEIDQSMERKNEWTIRMTLFRIFAYPFSIFIIIFCVFYMLARGDLKGLFGPPLVGLYLYSDIKILMGKRKKN